MNTVWLWSPLMLLAVTSSNGMSTHHSCLPTMEHCFWTLEISFKLTMFKAGHPDGGQRLITHDGHLYDITDTNRTTIVSPDDVIVADGSTDQRLAIVINGIMPGPTITAYEGQKVTVNVINKLKAHSATVHWHGQWQRETPYMDGVAYVTQCPIPAGASFDYTWIAQPEGTYWYHSHLGAQLAQGLVGAFIVKPKPTSEPEPEPYEELVMMLQGWNNANGPTLLMYKDPAFISVDASMSGLINGRGRHYTGENGTLVTKSPLTTFNVTSGKTYRVRLLNVGGETPFRFSIDQHKLKVVASDGFAMEHVSVNAIIINVGERYDFLFTPRQGDYWIRGDHYNGDGTLTHIRAEAILSVDNNDESKDEPRSMRHSCLRSDKCKFLNCPSPSLFKADGDVDDGIECVNVGRWRSHGPWVTPGAGGHVIEDVFLHFGFPGGPPSINGRSFVKPHVNALSQPQEIGNSCDDAGCGPNKQCSCSHSLTLEFNKTYQMIITGGVHPVHMHGHTFYVVKVGYNLTDINCGGNFCNDARWADPTWGGNNIPGLELSKPARKDVVAVPADGYVVIRILADNPGLWFMHCHIETHNFWGMALMLNESFSRVVAPPPGNFKCGSFHDNVEESYSCDSIKCHNGGVCLEDEMETNGFKCACAARSSGRFCEIDVCDGFQCNNGGTCELIVNGASVQPVCECAIDWSGPHCDIPANVDLQCSTDFDCINGCSNGFGSCLENNVCNCHEDEFLHMEVTPAEVFPGCTTSMSLRCSLLFSGEANSTHANIHWTSLVISTINPFIPIYPPGKVTLAVVTYFESIISHTPARLYGPTAGKPLIEVAGTLLPSHADRGFLSITWNSPSTAPSGPYTCVANGVRKTLGTQVSFTKTIDVDVGPHTDSAMIAQLNGQIKDLQDSHKEQVEDLQAQIESLKSSPAS